tara:strand:+ start:220134 stop:220997 length:864 start_codon:yes stop_codon:yes gene_type:complete
LKIFGDIKKLESLPPTKTLLMADPKYYEVSYAINVHMIDEKGELKSVDKSGALRQWLNLKREFENHNLKVEVVPAAAGLPDLVFTANQSLSLPGGRVLLSKMKSEQRAPEVEKLKSWYQKQGTINFYQMENIFESMGDLIWYSRKKLFFGGYGFRTDEQALEEMYRVTNIPIIGLKLQMEEFYHLDTCFSVLDEESLAYFPEAFDKQTNEFLKSWFKNIIILDEEEAINNFAGNCYCPDGKNVFLQNGSKKFEKNLRELNFNPVAVDTSEFIKGGGSVFCMKLPLFL